MRRFARTSRISLDWQPGSSGISVSERIVCKGTAFVNRTFQVFLVSQDGSLGGETPFVMGGATLHPNRVGSLEDLVDVASVVAAGCAVIDATSPQAAPDRVEHLLANQSIEVPTIVLIQDGDVQTAVRLMKAGAIDVLEKGEHAGAVIQQINQRLASDAFNVRQHVSRGEIRRRLAKLTAGERAVLEGVVAGKPNKTIASQLGFSLRTIELWRRNVMNKLEVDSVAELVKLRMQVEPAARTQPRVNGCHYVASGTN